CRFEGKPFEVFSFWNGGNDRMIDRLEENMRATQDTMRVEGRFHYDLLERGSIDVVRAAECGQRTARPEQLERAQMDLLITAESIGNRGAIARKRGRIKDDQVELWDDLLMGAGSGLSFEPVENIGRLEGASIADSIRLCTGSRSGNGRLTLVY